MYISTTPEKRIWNLKMIRIPKPDFFLIQRLVHFQLSLFFWEETDPFEQLKSPICQAQSKSRFTSNSFGAPLVTTSFFFTVHSGKLT